MKNIPLSMTETLATIYPLFEFSDNQPATEQQVSQLLFRITMINQLLIACLEMAEKDDGFWSKINLADFKKYLTQNKAVIFDIQPYFQEGSKIIAILDKMNVNIRKLEKLLIQATAFNFDLVRMENRLNDSFHSVPQDVTNVAEFRNWLKGIANGN